MDIPAMSIGLQSALLKQSIAYSVQKISMETQTQDMEAIRKLMESSVTPHVGGNIDIQV